MGIINDKLDKLLPFVRGFRYEEKTLQPHVSILFPHSWSINHLNSNELIIEEAVLNEASKAIIVGFKGQVHSDGIDYLFEEIEKEILFNQEQENKKLLFQEKLKELEKFVNLSTLEDVKNLQILNPEMIAQEIINTVPIIEDIQEKKEPVIISPSIELVDDEISYNPNMDLPFLPGIIDDINNYKEG